MLLRCVIQKGLHHIKSLIAFRWSFWFSSLVLLRSYLCCLGDLASGDVRNMMGSSSDEWVALLATSIDVRWNDTSIDVWGEDTSFCSGVGTRSFDILSMSIFSWFLQLMLFKFFWELISHYLHRLETLLIYGFSLSR